MKHIHNPIKPDSPNLPLTSIIMDQDYYLDQCQTYYENEDLNMNELDEEAMEEEADAEGEDDQDSEL